MASLSAADEGGTGAAARVRGVALVDRVPDPVPPDLAQEREGAIGALVVAEVDEHGAPLQPPPLEQPPVARIQARVPVVAEHEIALGRNHEGPPVVPRGPV